MQISDADRSTWHDISREVFELQRVAFEAGDRFAALADQVALLEKAVAGQKVEADVSSRVEALSKKITDLRGRLLLPAPGSLGGDAALRITNYPGRIASLKGQLIQATALPTAVQRMRITESRTGLAKAVAEANDVLDKDLPAVVSLLQQQRLQLPSLTRLAPFPGVSQF